MLWSKQFYFYDVPRWLEMRGAGPGSECRPAVRNVDWFHMVNGDVISMPDKWEYPWYASWDLAFHTLALVMVDPALAKQQLLLMLEQNYLHPNGQVPAYEWNFSDVNPPVQAWAAISLYRFNQELFGRGDLPFLEAAFHRLLMNFTWWVNRKDRNGNNAFEGGFLGLDNIGVFDRSAPLPTGGYLEQADGTAWMAFFCQSMLEIAVELAVDDPAYEPMVSKFFEHFVWIASAMNRAAEEGDGMWDEEDGFFYDLLRLPDGQAVRLKVRSLVGLLALAASVVYPGEEKLPAFAERARWFSERHGHLFANLTSPAKPGVAGRRLLALLDEDKLRRVLSRMLDENEFLSDYGIRSLSRVHENQPYQFTTNGQEFSVRYEPAESTTGMFGGNSNWRGPIWFPINGLLVRGLLNLYLYYGDDFTVECPTGSGKHMNLYQVAAEITRRLESIFRRDGNGRRPVFGGQERFQDDPAWRDHLLFYEYFHGDNGAGLGASHQTGWTGVIARLMQLFALADPEQMLAEGARLAYYGFADELLDLAARPVP
jgi:hypothetical protein